jgi:hypothetical protein
MILKSGYFVAFTGVLGYTFDTEELSLLITNWMNTKILNLIVDQVDHKKNFADHNDVGNRIINVY